MANFQLDKTGGSGNSAVKVTPTSINYGREARTATATIEADGLTKTVSITHKGKDRTGIWELSYQTDSNGLEWIKHGDITSTNITDVKKINVPKDTNRIKIKSTNCNYKNATFATDSSSVIKPTRGTCKGLGASYYQKDGSLGAAIDLMDNYCVDVTPKIDLGTTAINIYEFDIDIPTNDTVNTKLFKGNVTLNNTTSIDAIQFVSVFEITQASTDATLSVSPTSLTFEPDSTTSQSFNITSNTSWTITVS